MSTFDPLGFLSYVIVGGKLILRELWRRDFRCYFSAGLPDSLNLHIFVDASEDSFAAVAYWRWISDDGKIGTSFVTSKTKCAPLKRVTIPRLELQAAVLGTRLMQTILDGHGFTPEKCILWSDSKTVLKWIASSHHRYKPYVAHRIAEILASTETDSWKWVSTHDNVADDATRAFNNIDFSSSTRWLTGPEFLLRNEDEWPNNYKADDSNHEDEEELRPKISLIKRTTAWALRFINRCRKKEVDVQYYCLTASELESAEQLLCLLIQKERFSTEVHCIKNNQSFPKNSNLVQMTPYIDENGLLRLYGRIDAAIFLPYSSRRPVILPYDHSYTTLVVHHYHCQMKDQNHEATICEIRKKYWIPQVRRLLRKVISSCMLCRYSKATPRIPIMGPLPIDRLAPNVRPFKYTGLDYFGPLTVAIGRRSEKRWVALFTCLTIRAIHLEVAHDLSTDSCIIAMRNFMNCRGVPVRLRSDNGKNFIGANEEAKRFTEVFEAERIQNELSGKGVEWVFNCPINTSEGGIWERMVQCVKKVLRKTLKDVSPKEHVLQSLLLEAENIVNSRPLTHLPISPDEEEPLTPNHFLVGYGNVAQTPPADEADSKLCSLRKQWRIARSLRDRFWKRWVLEYLPTLTRRVKWCERTTPLKDGDMVFICDPNLPNSQWRRGIVIRV
ncbi:uncharacterized protein LOC119610147 [Lucilia sericata]|uniref:uncharacterized protein LOC119610147 n=1 Tax=Lucilia sericata TaxID=13632 RepID=UPI0018A83C3B|nr:uncharacterized protein LOC119610147 [Lucilia sericata]